MSAATSGRGLPQLSAENANSVSTPMPSPGAASTTRRTASAPARCPAVRGSPRRAAQRPFPSITTATCSGALGLAFKLLCIAKSLPKKFSRRREALHQTPARSRVGAGGGRCIGDHGLEDREIVEEAPAPRGREPAGRLRAMVAEALRDLDQAGLLEDAQMAAQVAVGQAAELLQVAEGEPLGVGGQRGEKRETRPLVDHAVEPLVGKAPRRGVSSRHRRRPPPGGG